MYDVPLVQATTRIDELPCPVHNKRGYDRVDSVDSRLEAQLMGTKLTLVDH